MFLYAVYNFDHVVVVGRTVISEKNIQHASHIVVAVCIQAEDPETETRLFRPFLAIMQRASRLKRELQMLSTEPPPGISCWQAEEQIDELRARQYPHELK